MKNHVGLLLLISVINSLFGQQSYTKSPLPPAPFKGKVGLAYLPVSAKPTTIEGQNLHDTFMAMSVIKFPVAIYTLHLVEIGKLKLQEPVIFDSVDLIKDTYSPLRDSHQGVFAIPLSDVIEYAVSSSDNIACDKLFDLVGGPKDVQDFFKIKGLKEIGIGTRYRDMRKNGFMANWCTPFGIVTLLDQFIKGKFIKNVSLLSGYMNSSITGASRLRAGLLPNHQLMHKTGTYYDNDTMIAAINDIGIILNEKKKTYFSVVVLVNNAEGPAARIEHYMAEVCQKACFKNEGRK